MPGTAEPAEQTETAKPEISGQKEAGRDNLEEKEPGSSAERTADDLGPENKGFFEKMSEGGKNIMNKAYEGLYNIPGVNKAVAKMEIAYNQFWLDKNEEKLVELKSKMEKINLENGDLDRSKEEISALIERLQQQKMPGGESLQSKLKDISQKRMDSEKRGENIRSELGSNDAKIKLYAGKRDMAADKLIGHYDEKLETIGKEMDSLQYNKDKIDLSAAVAEAKHKEETGRLEKMEESKREVEEALKRTGMPEKEAKNYPAIKELEKALKEGREKIKAEKEEIEKKKIEIGQKVAKVEAKVNSYKAKRGEFVRVKERRPLEKARDKEPGKGETEKERSGGSEGTRTERGKDAGEQMKALLYISGWNKYLQKKYGETVSGELIDQDDFLRTTGLSEGNILEPEDFKDILGKYYKLRKIPADKFNQDIDGFLEKKIKTGK